MQRPNAGSFLSRTFSVFGESFGLVMSITFLVHLPLLLFSVMELPQILQTLSALVLTPIATAALVYGVFKTLRHEPTNLGDCLGVAIDRGFSVVGASIVVGIATALGMLACIIPGFIVAAGLAVVIPALIVEKAGVSDSLSRSWELTRDYRFSLFAALLLIGLITMALSLLSGVLLVPGGFEAIAAGEMTVAYSLVTFVMGLFASSLQSVLATIAYHDLRVFKDGIDEDELASIFD